MGTPPYTTYGTGGFNTQTGTTYTLTKGDSGNVVWFTSSSTITLNVPLGLGPMNVEIGQYGAGVVTPTAALGVTIVALSSHTTTAGAGSSAFLWSPDGVNYIFGGSTA